MSARMGGWYQYSRAMEEFLYNGPACYEIAFHGNIYIGAVYIGATDNLRSRVRSHKNGDQLVDEFIRGNIYHPGLVIRYKPFYDVNDAFREESYRLYEYERQNGFLPLFNLKHGNY